MLYQEFDVSWMGSLTLNKHCANWKCNYLIHRLPSFFNELETWQTDLFGHTTHDHRGTIRVLISTTPFFHSLCTPKESISEDYEFVHDSFTRQSVDNYILYVYMRNHLLTFALRIAANCFQGFVEQVIHGYTFAYSYTDELLIISYEEHKDLRRSRTSNDK